MAALEQTEMEARLRALLAQPGDLLVFCNAYRGRLYTRPAAGGPWLEDVEGDLGEKAPQLLGPAAKAGRLWWQEISGSLAGKAPGNTVPATRGAIRAWNDKRAAVTVISRRGDVKIGTERKVFALAAGHCQYDGCGEDLRHHHLNGKPGNYAYLAHIIAASADGPRGDSLLSEQLADDPENILLLCDRCHRLVDRVDPDAHPIELLRQMRERSIAAVNRALRSLRYQKSTMIVVGGMIEGQNSVFDSRAGESAMWANGLQVDGDPLWFMHNGGLPSDSTTAEYWAPILENLQNEVGAFKQRLSGASNGGAQINRLAVFPTHNSSILALAGRIIGDSRTAHVFQPNRSVPADRWQWQKDPQRDGFFSVAASNEPSTECVEANLAIHLTARLAPSDWLPPEKVTLPTVTVAAADPSHAVIATPHDLDRVAVLVDQALAIIQDKWRAKRIHVSLVAPASACLRFGQKLQARHHAEVVFYERRRQRDPHGPPFVATVAIRSHQVEHVASGRTVSI